ncbi:MAG: OmpA family protein [Cytophagales bacterium]|nr:OmpA family protein [Cytophagales bacterium]
MIRTTLILAFAFFIHVAAFAQQKDTLTYAQGKIFNKATKEAVTGRITYHSQPYGNIVGILNGSSYLFPMYGHVKYSIEVQAPGFSAAKYMLDPAASNADRKVLQDIELEAATPNSMDAQSEHHVGKVMRLEALIFQQRSFIISPESYPELNKVAEMLHGHPRMVIQLEGHTDTRGDAKLNIKLSEERVDAVRDYLIRRGVSKNRIRLQAYGGSKPLSNDDTEEAHQLNRRVEVRIVTN